RDNYVTEAVMEEALKRSAETQRMIGKVLIEMGKVAEADFFKMLSIQRKMKLIALQDLTPILDTNLALKMSKAFCQHNYTVPYQRDGDTVHVVTSEPTIDTVELMKALKCKKVDINLSTFSDITTLLRRIFDEEDNKKKSKKLKEREFKGSETLEDVPITDTSTHVTAANLDQLTKKYQTITNSLLLQAIIKSASDIHIEVYEKRVCVRYRVDGTLYDNTDIRISKDEVSGVINVLKINASLNIAERRLPQGGRFRRMTADEEVYDFRVQTQPTLHGENIVIRLLRQTGSYLDLNELGFLPDVKTRYEQLITNPSGLVLITGPTGSGKTTTLYSTLAHLSKDLKKKIITIEDPVEYSMDRIQQSQINEHIGFGFPEAVRAFLREDPDIMLIGEIRDRETAVEALRASQTGHLVFSTLHVNNTIETIQRLLDLDLVPGTIAAEMVAIVAQRLAKRNCPYCKSKYRPEKELLDAFYPGGVSDNLKFYKGMGCERCDFMGHSGRVAVFEFWFVDLESKKLVIENAGFAELYDNAITRGLTPMIKDALIKVEQGIIALDELTNIIPHFQISRWKGM
ncbi:MAG: GspE/PulE family protein, partial [Thermodesulfobacteriota bacterium]